jgi:hypothetical protein
MTCRSRSFRSGVAIVASLFALPAIAADLPPIKATDSNRVPECATPGRLIAYIRERNPKLDARYDGIAGDYMRHGEARHIRWDYAFFQMLLETGYLTYKGDVKPEQNNFAGLGATGGGARGESFKDVSTGVQAHIEHLLMYSGERVESPVAERTRNIQEWGVLTSWQQGLTGPITFSQMAKKWAPGSRRYVSDIDTIADRFYDGLCKQPDPQAEVVADASGGADQAATTENTAKAETPPMTRGLEAQKRALEAAKAEGGGSVRAALGAVPSGDKPAKAANVTATPDTSESAQPAAQNASATPPVTLLNGEPPAAEKAADTPAKAADAKAPADKKAPAAEKKALAAEKKAAPEASKSIEVAALPGDIKSAGKIEKPAAAASGKCRVWTASYGGAKAIIIKAVVDATVNYTVLDVNDGAEKREADAYISAYAKGGQSIGEFTTQSQALEKAFELCPEG